MRGKGSWCTGGGRRAVLDWFSTAASWPCPLNGVQQQWLTASLGRAWGHHQSSECPLSLWHSQAPSCHLLNCFMSFLPPPRKTHASQACSLSTNPLQWYEIYRVGTEICYKYYAFVATDLCGPLPLPQGSGSTPVQQQAVQAGNIFLLSPYFVPCFLIHWPLLNHFWARTVTKKHSGTSIGAWGSTSVQQP